MSSVVTKDEICHLNKQANNESKPYSNQVNHSEREYFRERITVGE